VKQSKLASWIESITSTAVGFGISLFAQWLFLPLLGVSITLSQNLTFAIIMTFISIGRGFVLRRIFEHFGIRTKLSPFMQAVVAERRRQIEAEGWDLAHDDQHLSGEMARAGASYAWGTTIQQVEDHDSWVSKPPIPITGLMLWPWGRDWYKPAGFRRDLVKAAALILAEGEKFDRNRKRKPALKEAA
jgi:hypothetical protein